MQKQLDALPTKVKITILGVNAAGLEDGNSTITAGRTLPWLQDTTSADVWSAWQVTWRDVVILDAKNERVAVYNLTTYDLATQLNYATLEKLLIDTANAQ